MPTDWTKTCTVLAHEKDKNDDPSNFRSIALESVPLSSLEFLLLAFGDSIFTFHKENNFIEAEIQ